MLWSLLVSSYCQVTSTTIALSKRCRPDASSALGTCGDRSRRWPLAASVGEISFVTRNLLTIVRTITIADLLMDGQRSRVTLGRRRFDQVEVAILVLAPDQHRLAAHRPIAADMRWDVIQTNPHPTMPRVIGCRAMDR